ncbi:MAG: type IV pilus modification protein PilV [Thioalkalivibrionaceae bacterium]
MDRRSFRQAIGCGFTLIEVLIALLVVSIGLLALAGLQTKALTSAHSSYLRSVAAIQATDLVERAWADLCVLSGAGSSVTPNAAFTNLVESWNAANNGLLPDWNTQATAFDPATGAIEIDIRWNEPRFVGDSTEERFTYATRLPLAACGRDAP